MGGFRLFTLANVPVSVSPWFLFLLYYLSRGSGVHVAVAAFAITLSLLVHEFGHALMARRFGMTPEILLHGWGGHTTHGPAQRDSHDALIVAAGPGAGFMLAAVAYATLTFAPLPSIAAAEALSYLMWVNVVWSIFNLLPVWPMDGGLLYRLGMLRMFKKPMTAERVTHITGIVLVGLLVLVAISISAGIFAYLILGMMGFQNYQALSAGSGQEVRRDNPRAKDLLAQAERAYEDGEDDFAARLCHQLRAESNLPPKVLARAWTILGVTTTRKGEYEEALSYLKRAPESPEVVEALAQCLYQLDMHEELAALTQSKGFERLPKDTQAQIKSALQG